MDGQADSERDRALSGVDNSAAEGDGDRGRYSMMVRCASQSSLDESSQRPAGGGAGPDAHAAQPARLLAALARLRRDAVLCDVRLHARAAPDASPSAALPAHRAVLAAASPYFHAMFTQFDESTQPTITIQNVEPAALEAIIEYVYTPDSLVITEDNVQSLLSAASLLAVGGVRAACCVFLAGALAPDNALGIRAFAELHACADLSTAAARFIENHFVEVLDTEEFLALEADTLAQLLDNDRITVPSEEAILDAVVRWMQQAPGARAPHLGALLEHVRLPLLAQDALVARANAEPLCSAGLRVKDLVIEALSYHLMRPERRAACAAGCARARPRQPPRAPRLLLVVGGQAPKAVRDVEALQLDAARWRPAADLLTRRCRAGLGVVGGKVYAVGGFNGTLRVRSVDVYDVATDTWSAGPPLCARRSTLGVAVIGHVIYAVGGARGGGGPAHPAARANAARARPARRVRPARRTRPARRARCLHRACCARCPCRPRSALTSAARTRVRERGRVRWSRLGGRGPGSGGACGTGGARGACTAALEATVRATTRFRTGARVRERGRRVVVAAPAGARADAGVPLARARGAARAPVGLVRRHRRAVRAAAAAAARVVLVPRAARGAARAPTRRAARAARRARARARARLHGVGRRLTSYIPSARIPLAWCC